MAKSRSSSRCASIPEELLDLIFDKVLSNSVYDYIRCSTVCKKWFYCCADKLQHDYSYRSRMKQQQQLPLLLIPTVDEDDSTHRRSLYNILNNSSSISSRLSVPYIKRPCCGSSHGWLIFAQDTLALTLFNPFTGATIHLPPLLTQKQLREIKDIYQYYFCHEYEIIKVALSDDPSSNNYEVLALQFHGRLALFTSRGGRWIYTENYFDYLGYLMEIMHDDIIYFKGKFRALIGWKLGSIEIYNIDDEPYIRFEPLKGLVDEIINIMTRPIEDPDVIWCTYLAESITGTLLYVERFTIRRFGIYLPWRYRVYELEEEEADGIKKFIQLAGNIKGGGERVLGDQALFLGYNQSVSVRASDFPGCKPNSIYFTEDEPYDKLGPMYLGVYTLGRDELDNSSVYKPLYKLDPSHTHLPPPIWIVPQPNLTL